MARTHKDVEFHVDLPNGQTKIYSRFDEACEMAVIVAASNGKTTNLDVVIYSRAGARSWQGDEGVEAYNFDPDTSVFERIAIRADAKGRIP